MTREEAVKRLKERIDRQALLLDDEDMAALTELIPELAESEDKRIRKVMLEHFKCKTKETWCGLPVVDIIAYLEKQKEKEIPKWMPKFLDELRSKKHYFDWDEHRDIEGSILAIINFIAPDYFTEKDKKEQKPISEVFGFKVGDAVRLKDGDGRKHIIKSIEEVEGIHGPNFYHVEFEDNSARGGIYPGEEYPNGYYTQMEKIEEEQKLEEEDHITPNKKFFQWIYDRLVFIHGENPDVDYMRSLKDRIEEMTSKQKPAEWSEEDEKIITRLIDYFESFRIAGVATKWEGLGVQEVITLLKSLRPSWKPSEEQMDALKCAVMDVAKFSKRGGRQVELEDEPYYSALHSLYEQLKKLM